MKSQNNYNQLVLMPAGSGMSILVHEYLLKQATAANATVLVIDKGQSSEEFNGEIQQLERQFDKRKF